MPVASPQSTEEAGAGSTVVAEASATPTVVCENQTHTVNSGETLGVIAEQYGVTIDDLITLNQLVDPAFNPDFLFVGQQIAVPVCGIPTLTPVSIPTNTPQATQDIPAPIATVTDLPPGAVDVYISRVLYPGDVTREAVEIVNNGSPVDLEGWVLRDKSGDNKFVFPSFRLFTDGGVTIFTGVGENTPIDLYWGLTTALWSVGDTIRLFDDTGTLLDEFKVTQ
jgi:murein DD-endopeptidase MepM/ murein hydrolase activator NlpD